MKSLNAKRIAAIVTGAALLGAGLAFAGPLTFQNVPIISNSGQPVVQVVIGSSAKPSDGVAAGNIAAAIGNLAYTSTAVVPIINTTKAQSLLSVSVSSAKYSLSNQQVWLNESGVTSATGSSYLFSALIGSVLNQGVQLGSPQYTKALQTGTTYAFQRSSSTTLTASPYYSTTLSTPPTGGTTPSTSNNNAANTGGGVTFSTFTTGSYDNILQVTNSQFSSLANNWGSNGETESLFLTGFPVYDQANSGSIQNKFALLSAGGAYVATFGKPVANAPSGGGTGNINVPIRLLGQNYTIINGTGTGSGTVTGSSTLNGGKIALASSIAPLQTVYVGHNVSSGPWTVQLQDLAQTTNGLNAPAAIAVFYNGVQTNETTVNTTQSTKVNVSGHILFVNVQQTFAGLYAYQKWAKIQLYAGVYRLQDGKVFNQTNDPGWIVNLFWTNTTGGTLGDALRSIVLYNSTPTSLTEGQSFNFIQNPSVFKLTFLGDTLGNNYDALTTSLSTASTGQYYYSNSGANANSHGNPSNITEPAQLLTVTSGINNAFSYGGQTGSQLTYVLTPYSLSYTSNAATGTVGYGTLAVLSYNNNAGTSGNFINANAPLTVSVTGFTSPSAGSATTLPNVQFSAASNSITLSQPLYNVTAITIQNGRALPLASGGSFSVTIENTVLANALSTLTEGTTPLVLLKQANGQTYNQTLYTGGNTILYNQQNGQQTGINVNLGSGARSGTVYQFYTFNVAEEPVPQNTVAQDSLAIGIYNTTGSQTQSQLLQMNYSINGQHNNATYISTQGYTFPVQVGFRTEKGSTVASISPTSDTFDLATAVDQLQFALTNTASNVVVSKSTKTVGPYSVGQATNLPNVSIAAVNASISLSGTESNYTILGLGNLTEAISTNPSTATTPVWLTNLSSTAPLVVLDSNANAGSNLILVGSGYVNSLSQQLQSAYNVQVSASSAPIVQAYGGNRILVAGYYANQTTAAANSFISQLYTAAASST